MRNKYPPPLAIHEDYEPPEPPKIYVVVAKDAGHLGIELFLLNQPCEPGCILAFGINQDTRTLGYEYRPNMDDANLEVFQVSIRELTRGVKTLKYDDPRTTMMLTRLREELAGTLHPDGNFQINYWPRDCAEFKLARWGLPH